jgi:hypothetical protein
MLETHKQRIECNNTVRFSKKPTFDFEQTAVGGLKITAKCRVTKKTHSITLSKAEAQGYVKWKRGARITEAMPSVSADDRDFLMTSTSPKGLNIIFADREEF